jgi:hypothetical protein
MLTVMHLRAATALAGAGLLAAAGAIFAAQSPGPPAPSAPSAAMAPRTRIDIAKLGPQVGQRVPDFSLRDAAGKTWTLQSIMGPKGAMLVFFRSADW